MKTQSIEVIMNISDIKIAERFMTKALAELISDKINKLPMEYRKEVCEEILKVENIICNKNLPKK